MLQVDTIEDDEVHLRYMAKDGNVYRWPSVDEYSYENIAAIVYVMETPMLVNSRCQFRFSEENMDVAQQRAVEKTNIKTVTFE